MKLSETGRKKLKQAAENAMSFSTGNLAAAYGGDSATVSYNNLRKAAANLSNSIKSSDNQEILKAIDDFEAAMQSTLTISATAPAFQAQSNPSATSGSEADTLLAALDSVREELGGGQPLEAGDKQSAAVSAGDEKPKTTKLGYLIVAAALFLLVVGAWLMLIKDKWF